MEGLEGVLLRAWAFGEQMRFPSWSDLNLMGRWWGTWAWHGHGEDVLLLLEVALQGGEGG